MLDGIYNVICLECLKEKFGNCFNVSSEVEFDNVIVWLLGDEGDGIC